MSEFRGFIAIDIDAVSKIIEFEEEIKRIGTNIKLVEPKNIHITLKFLGDTSEDKIEEIKKVIKDSVEKIKPFKIVLEGTGVFPNQNYIKVIWVGIKGVDQVRIIADTIDEKLSRLGFGKEKRSFSAHLTVGRIKSAKNKDKILQTIEKYKDFEFAEFEVKSIKLKKSELAPKGPIYTTLKEIKL